MFGKSVSRAECAGPIETRIADRLVWARQTMCSMGITLVPRGNYDRTIIARRDTTTTTTTV